jgi:hypothetical protein
MRALIPSPWSLSHVQIGFGMNGGSSKKTNKQNLVVLRPCTRKSPEFMFLTWQKPLPQLKMWDVRQVIRHQRPNYRVQRESAESSYPKML